MSLSESLPFVMDPLYRLEANPYLDYTLLVGPLTLRLLTPLHQVQVTGPTLRDRDAEMAESGTAGTLVESFIAAGIPKGKAESTAKNGKLAAILGQLVNDNDIVDATKNPKQGNLLLHLAGIEQDQQFGRDESNLLARAIHDGRLQSLDQVNGARGCALTTNAPSLSISQ